MTYGFVLPSFSTENLLERQKFLTRLRTFNPDQPGRILSEAMSRWPERIIDLIERTKLEPTGIPGRNGNFNHELENFIFCLNEAEIHQHPLVTKSLWRKLVDETPEPILYGLEFINEFIEAHPNWEKFAEFVFRELFGKPRIGWTDTRKVIDNLVAVNNMWLSVIISAKRNISHGHILIHGRYEKIDPCDKQLAERICERKKFWEEEEKEISSHKNRLTKEESRKVIQKINELFF